MYRSDWVSDEMATETRRGRASSRLVGTPRHLGRPLVSAELGDCASRRGPIGSTTCAVA
jgi:hypothetical protein